MLSHKVHLVTKSDPIRYLLSQPVLSGRSARWLFKFSEFEITSVPKRAIKGQAIADLLAENPVLDRSDISSNLPDSEVLVVETDC